MGNDSPHKIANQTVRLPKSFTHFTSTSQAPRRRLMLFVFHRDGVRTIPLSAMVPVVVGRDPMADLQIADNSLSRLHARISLDGEQIVIEDLESTNGTRVRGSPVTRAVIDIGEEVSLGGLVAFVHELSAGKASHGGGTVAGVDAYDAFREALAQEIIRARFFHRSLATVTIRPLERMHSGNLRHVCVRLRDELRPVDRITLYSADCIEVGLPEMDQQGVFAMLEKVLAPRPDEPMLVAGIAAFPGHADNVDKLLQISREAVRQTSSKNRIHAESDHDAWTRNAASDEQTVSRGPIAESKEMKDVLATAARLSRSSIPVLVLGETGTGKEVLARVIHDTSRRKDKPLVIVNCAAIPQQLVESTLFGHEKGAFTGAVNQHKGVFEAAAGGTVFLDEIGELPPAVQAALLRVLEVRKICRVGSTKELAVDVRIIAATHRDLESMAEAGTFRADLLYRLNTMTLHIPPLRNRRDDIGPLAARFLEMARIANEATARRFDPDALKLLVNYHWPGNVRELRNAIERAVVIASGEVIHCLDLPERIRMNADEPEAVISSMPLEPTNIDNADDVPPWNLDDVSADDHELAGSNFREIMRKLEVDVLLKALREADGNQTRAAKNLDLPRRTFQHKLKQLGIRRLGYAAADESKRP